MGMLHNCGLVPNNCLPCLAGTTSSSDEKRKSLTSSPRKKPALRLSFKWKDRHANPTLCDVARVDGQLAVARAFGDKSLKEQLSSEPDVSVESIDDDTKFVILASDGVWKVLSNQEAMDCIKHIKDARSATKHLIEEALARKSTDDIHSFVFKLN